MADEKITIEEDLDLKRYRDEYQAALSVLENIKDSPLDSGALKIWAIKKHNKILRGLLPALKKILIAVDDS